MTDTELLEHMCRAMAGGARRLDWNRRTYAKHLFTALVERGCVDETRAERLRIGRLLSERTVLFEHVDSYGSPRSATMYRMACTLPEALEKLQDPPRPMPWLGEVRRVPLKPCLTVWERLLEIDYG